MRLTYQILLLSCIAPAAWTLYNLIGIPIVRAMGAAWHPGESSLAHEIGSSAVCGIAHLLLLVFCLARPSDRRLRDSLLTVGAFLTAPVVCLLIGALAYASLPQSMQK